MTTGAKYHDGSTYATDAINIELDLNKLKFVVPEIFSLFQRLKYKLKHWGFESYIEQVAEHIRYGDSQAAIVVCTNPLLIAAYNTDIDCVTMLRFKENIQKKYMFNLKDRLVCVNTFGQESKLQSDLIKGEKAVSPWTMVHPIIAELVSNSHTAIQNRKNQIGDNGYQYVWDLAQNYLKLKPDVFRDGKPFYAANTL